VVATFCPSVIPTAPGSFLSTANKFLIIWFEVIDSGHPDLEIFRPRPIVLVKCHGKVDWHSRLRKSEKHPQDENRIPIVPTVWSTGGSLVSTTITSITIAVTLCHFNAGEVILAPILGFILSFIGTQSVGQANVNPVSTIANACSLF